MCKKQFSTLKKKAPIFTLRTYKLQNVNNFYKFISIYRLRKMYSYYSYKFYKQSICGTHTRKFTYRNLKPSQTESKTFFAKPFQPAGRNPAVFSKSVPDQIYINNQISYHITLCCRFYGTTVLFKRDPRVISSID